LHIALKSEIEQGKKEKKSWYQYVFLGLARENEATEEARIRSF